MSEILSGKETAKVLDENSREMSEKLSESFRTPCLAVVRVGNKGADISYEKGILKKAEKTGVSVNVTVIPDEDPNEAQKLLEDTILKLNADKNVDGILLFRPLPKTMDEKKAINMIAKEKDVDGVSELSMAAVYSGDPEGFAPCTPEACIKILDHYNIDPTGMNSVVIGRSLVVGKPLAMMLLKRNSTVTLCHTKTRNLPDIASKADLLFVSAGRANMVGADYISQGQTVIDVGINFTDEGKLTGDVDFESVKEKAGMITPVPGGVGSVTTAVLMSHVIVACKRASSCK